MRVSNIVYNNVIGTSAIEEAIKFNCSENVPCEGIILNNVQLQYAKFGKDVISKCSSAYGIATQSTKPPSCLN